MGSNIIDFKHYASERRNEIYALKLAKAFPRITTLEILNWLECCSDEELDMKLSNPREAEKVSSNADFLIRKDHEVYVDTSASEPQNLMLGTIVAFTGMQAVDLRKDETLRKALEAFDEEYSI